MRRFFVTLLLFVVVVASAAELTPELYQRYRGLRRDFLVAVALAPRAGGVRREHGMYHRRASRFLADAPSEAHAAKAAVQYRRGRILLHCERHKAARRDFDATLKYLDAAGEEETKVGGVPRGDEVRAYRAFTFLGEGVAPMLAELRKIESPALRGQKQAIGKRLRGLVMELERKKRYAEAIRVYEEIARLDAWDGEADNPEKHIAILRAKMEATGQ